MSDKHQAHHTQISTALSTLRAVTLSSPNPAIARTCNNASQYASLKEIAGKLDSRNPRVAEVTRFLAHTGHSLCGVGRLPLQSETLRFEAKSNFPQTTNNNSKAA